MFNLAPFKKGRNSLFNIADDFFNDDFFKFDDKFFAPFYGSHSLKADIKDNGNAYEVDMDVPGIEKEDIQIDYINNNLIVTGKRNYDNEVKKDNYIRCERSYGEFKRAFYVDDVDENKISASFKNGVLKIILPKLHKEEPKGKRINIE